MATALVLQHLLERNEALSECAARWPRYVIQKTKITFPKEKLNEVYDVLKSEMSSAHWDETDGLRIYWSDERKWVHIRPSGTEPVVRLIAEACDQNTVEALMDDVARHFDDVQ